MTAGQQNLKLRAAQTMAIRTMKIQKTTLPLVSILYTNELYRIRASATPPQPAATATPTLKNLARRRPPIILTTRHTEKRIQPVVFEVSRLRKTLNTKRVDTTVKTVEPTMKREILKKRLPRMPKMRPKTMREQPTMIG